MKKAYTVLSRLLLTSLVLGACGGASAQIAESNFRREIDPNIPPAEIHNLVEGNNTFALDVYQALRSENGNLILSPYSISLALAMTYAGARGETESQLAQTLHFPPQAQVHPAFNALDLELNKKPLNLDKDQEPLQLNIANAVWAEQTFAFLPEFLDTLARNYGAGVRLADFINQPNQERITINNWVSDQTEDKINDLLPEDSVGPDTRMVLVNAIYFKADWLDQFDADDTYDIPFNLLDGSQVNVPMMGQGMYIPYASGDGYQAVELPYAGSTAAMNIIVPDEGRFEEIESALTYDLLEDVFGKMNQTSVMLRFPKFKFESSFALPDALKQMGMSDAFDSGKADFSAMTGGRDLFIGNVIHKAFVAVDEEGTEAAAATAVIMEATGAPMWDITLVIDRPFIFFIRDLQSGQILFIGRMLNPH
ncbi:MAG: serpin family protein [Anaerolineales bacterium]|nr:MAG: serpin family protein [Anaerolineales bacterium]